MATNYDQPKFRLYCKQQGSEGDYCVTVRDKKLVLAIPSDEDISQLWYKDQSYDTGFMLVNKAAAEVVQYNGVGDQLELVNKPNNADQRVLWTESEDVGNGYTFLRTNSNVDMVMDAHGGQIFDGTSISIYQNVNSTSEIWKCVPYFAPTYKIYCKRQGPDGDYCVAVQDDKLYLTRPSESDPTQYWYKDNYDIGFMLVNKATDKPIRHFGIGEQLKLVDKPSFPNQSVLWTQSEDLGNGYTFLRTQDNVDVVIDAHGGQIFDGTLVSIHPNINFTNEMWKCVPYFAPTYKLYCKRQGPDGDYCVAVQNNKLCLTLPNDNDLSQTWYKDDYSIGFMLVNKATGKSVQYSNVGDQLHLVNKPNNLDPSVLWTRSEDVGDGYTFIRTMSNVDVVMDAWEGHIYDGTLVSIYPNANSDNEFWKLIPYYPPIHKLFCKRQGPGGDYCVAVQDDKLYLTLPSENDPSQYWYKDSYDNGFMLVNKATNKPVRHFGIGNQLKLVNKPNYPNQSVLWTQSEDVGNGYTFLRTQDNVDVVIDAHGGQIFDGTLVSIYQNVDSTNEIWKCVPYFAPTYKIYCKSQGPDGDYCVAVKDDKLYLTRPSESDRSQYWYKDNYDIGFMLVNKATDKPIKHFGIGEQLKLVDKPSFPNQSVLWTQSEDLGNGYTFLRTQYNVDVVIDAHGGQIFDGTLVSIHPNVNFTNEMWKCVPYFAPTYKIYCKRQGPDGDYCVAVQNNKLCLTLPNDNDPSQTWYKDDYNIGFMLVNKATGKSVQYSNVGDQLHLVNKPNNLDPSVLWTKTEDGGDGYGFIRTMRNADVVMDAWGGHIFDGTLVSIYPHANSDSEFWKLVPYFPPIHKLFCKRQGPGGDYCVAVQDDKLYLTLPSENDPSQYWYKDNYDIGFMLVNKATNKPVRQFGIGNQLELVNKPNYPNQSVLWTQSEDVGNGYTFLRTQDNVDVVIDAHGGQIFDGTLVSIYQNVDSTNEIWKCVPYFAPTYKIYCKSQGPDGDYCVAVKDDKLYLTRPSESDRSQYWYKDNFDIGFMLVNKATDKPIKHFGIGEQLKLVDKPGFPNQSVLWTQSEDLGNGYTFLRTQYNVDVVIDAHGGQILDGTLVSIHPNVNFTNEMWKCVPYFAPTYKLYCKRQGPDGDYCVAVQNNKLCLTLPNDNDPSQTWYKDDYNIGFMLVNKATGKSVQYSNVGDQLHLVNKPNNLDPSVLWTKTEDGGDGYGFIRTMRNADVVMDAWEGHIYDGTLVSIYPHANSDSEFWKLVPYFPPIHKLFCKRQGPGGDYCVAVQDDKLYLTLPSENDPSQYWYKDSYDIGFMLVNKATDKPIRYFGIGNQLELVNKPNCPNESVLWTQSEDVGNGYTFLSRQDNVDVVIDAHGGQIFDGTLVSTYQNVNSDNEYWKLI